MRVLEDVAVPMRDGVTTRADVWLPDVAAPRPVLLVRSGYSKEVEALPPFVEPRVATARGFAVVVHDIRGRGASDGEFEPFALAEVPDGYDVIDWITRQDWCDGRVVATGVSYAGIMAWFAAASRHPALRALAPGLCSDEFGEGMLRTSGVLEHGLSTSWSAVNLVKPEQRWWDTAERAYIEPDALTPIAPWLTAWRSEPADGDYWAARSVRRRRPEIAVPSLVIAGWYDVMLAGSLASYAASTNPRDRLVIGPWGHDYNLSYLVGEANVGFEGNGPGRYFPWILDFHQAILDDRDPDSAPVRVYVLGAKRWLDLAGWPPDTAAPRRFPLPAGGFAVDPLDPVPTRGGRGLMAGVPDRGWGIRDQGPIAARADVATLPVDAAGPMFLAGPVRAHLKVAATGTTPRLWTAILCVTRPDGTPHNICEGVTRADPDAEEIVVELGHAGIVIQSGESLVLLVSGSSFPRWPLPDGPSEQAIRPGSTLELTVAPLDEANPPT